MEKASLQKRLYSESNLYLAAYLAPSYVFNEELLCSEDRQILHALKDAYNEDVYQETIESVKMRLQKTMTDPNDYFHTEVYFKPKSFKETKDGKEELPEEKTSYVQNGMITQEIDICVDLLFDQHTPTSRKRDCLADMRGQSDSGEIRLVCGGTKLCDQEQCPFICKWFFMKNNYLLPEINELASYLKRLPNQFYKTQVSVVLSPVQPNQLTNKQFGYVVDFVER